MQAKPDSVRSLFYALSASLMVAVQAGMRERFPEIQRLFFEPDGRD